jgi:mono/diheme cytochrome c family protein
MRKLFLLSFFSFLALVTIFSACGDENSIKYQRYYADGSQLYKVHCGNCHMSDGKGLAALIPPLTDTTYLRKNRDKLACFIVYGLNDTIVVNNQEYQGQMPAEKHLAAIDLAKVLTYITNSFGNQQGIYDITEVETNLKNCRN